MVLVQLFFLPKHVEGHTHSELDPTESVIHRVMYLLQNGFGNYHIFQNNCEEFAMYYKTGLLSIEQNGLGISGQETLIIGVTLAVIISSPFRLLLAGLVGVATVTTGVYCLSIYATDIGIQKDVAKVPVEDLAINLGYKSWLVNR